MLLTIIGFPIKLLWKILVPSLTKKTTKVVAGKVVKGTAIKTSALFGAAAVAGGTYYVSQNPNLLENTVRPPAQYEGKREQFVAAPERQTALDLVQPMRPLGERRSSNSGADGYVLKRTHQAIRDGVLSVPRSQEQHIISTPRVQMLQEERRPVKKGEALEILVKQYMETFNSASQVLPSDKVKVDEFARSKAAVFDQIAAIVFPVPNKPANDQAVAYIRSRESEDRRAISDLLGSIDFLQEAAKTSN